MPSKPLHWILGGALAFVLITQPQTAHASDPQTAALLKELGRAARCKDKKSPWRPWCIAVDGWQSGKPGTLPKRAALVGITVELEEGKSMRDALRDRVSVSVLALNSKAGKPVVKLTQVRPENKAENQQLGEVLMGVALVLKGKAKTARAPKGIASYFASLPAGATYPVSKSKRGHTWTGKSPGELRKVGAFWVAVETSTDGKGIFLTILTDRVK